MHSVASGAEASFIPGSLAERQKIGFVLLSPAAAPIPSTRIAALNMFPFLRDAGFDPVVAFDPQVPNEQPDVSGLADELLKSGCRIVVFQKVHGPSVRRLALTLRAAGLKTVWLVCDLVDPVMAEAVDATVVVTEFLRSLYPIELQAKIHVVHDGVERPDVHKVEWGERLATHDRPLRAVLVTSASLDDIPVIGLPPPWLEVTIVGQYSPENRRFQRARNVASHLMQKPRAERARYMRFALSRRIRCVVWDPKTVYEAMKSADVGIIPIDTTPEFVLGWRGSDWKVKSENRLTMKMSMALPVVATPIPSYETVIEQGVNGYLANSRAEWIQILDALREPQLRHAIGSRARESVLHRYSMAAQARRLSNVMHALVESEPEARTTGS